MSTAQITSVWWNEMISIRLNHGWIMIFSHGIYPKIIVNWNF
jgi:hypothetical protein